MRDNKKDIFNLTPPIINIISVSLLLFALGFSISWIFYKSFALSFVFALFSISFIKIYIKNYREKAHKKIEEEFYDINMLLSSELESGIPINMAIKAIKNDLKSSNIYDFKYMDLEIEIWSKKMKMGLKIEDIISDFAFRSQNENIIEYANMIKICSKKGGNIREIINNTNSTLNDKRQLKRDLDVLIAEKQLEQKIMSIMPVIVLIMLDKSAPEFIAPLYTNIVGRITMTILLILFIFCYLWSSKLSKLN